MFVKCSDAGITEEFGYEKEQLPLLVYFENQIPIEYDGKLTYKRSKTDFDDAFAAKKKSNKEQAIMTLVFVKKKDINNESIAGKKVSVFLKRVQRLSKKVTIVQNPQFFFSSLYLGPNN